MPPFKFTCNIGITNLFFFVNRNSEQKKYIFPRPSFASASIFSYNQRMSYFVKGLLSGNKKFFLFLGGAAVWVLAIFDFIANIRPPGLFNGKLFLVTAVATVVGGFYYLFRMYYKDLDHRRKTKMVEEHSAVFEPKREEEIREMIEQNPAFATLCYECIFFNPDLLHCNRDLSEDITRQRIKDIYINGRKYCLYWIPTNE